MTNEELFTPEEIFIESEKGGELSLEERLLREISQLAKEDSLNLERRYSREISRRLKKEYLAELEWLLIDYKKRKIIETENEGAIARAWLGMEGVIEREKERRKLKYQQNQAKAEGDQKLADQLGQKILPLNIANSDWQIDVAKFILISNQFREGEKIISSFWERWRQITEREGEEDCQLAYKTGIIGSVALVYLLDSLGYDSYFAPAYQDAKEGIDFWLLPKGKDYKEGTAIIQVQTRQKLGSLYHKLIEEYQRVSSLFDEETQKNIKKQNRFLKTRDKYANNWRVPIWAIWIDLAGVGPVGLDLYIDSKTGKPSPFLLRKIKNSDLEKTLARCFPKEERKKEG